MVETEDSLTLWAGGHNSGWFLWGLRMLGPMVRIAATVWRSEKQKHSGFISRCLSSSHEAEVWSSLPLPSSVGSQHLGYRSCALYWGYREKYKSPPGTDASRVTFRDLGIHWLGWYIKLTITNIQKGDLMYFLETRPPVAQASLKLFCVAGL